MGQKGLSEHLPGEKSVSFVLKCFIDEIFPIKDHERVAEVGQKPFVSPSQEQGAFCITQNNFKCFFLERVERPSHWDRRTEYSKT